MEEQMKIIQSTTVVDAQKEIDNAMYNIRYQYCEMNGEKILAVATVSVAEKTIGDAGEGYISLGDMVYNNGKISMSGFPYSDKTTSYMNDFFSIVEGIKKVIQGV